MLGGPAAQRVACSKRAAAQAHTDVHVHAHAHVYTKARAHMNTHTCPRTPLSPPPHDSPVQARASGCCALCQGTPLHALTARAPLSSGRHAGAAGPGSVRWWRAWRGGRGRWARPRGGALGPGPHSTPHPRQKGWEHPVITTRVQRDGLVRPPACGAASTAHTLYQSPPTHTLCQSAPAQL